MKKLLLAAFAAVSVPSLLACCGIWDEASKQAIGEQCRELSGKLLLVDDGPNKRKVQKVLDQCYVDAHAGKFGIVDIAMFAVKVEEAGRDGQLTDLEVEVIQNAYAEMAGG